MWRILSDAERPDGVVMKVQALFHAAWDIASGDASVGGLFGILELFTIHNTILFTS